MQSCMCMGNIDLIQNRTEQNISVQIDQNVQIAFLPISAHASAYQLYPDFLRFIRNPKSGFSLGFKTQPTLLHFWTKTNLLVSGTMFYGLSTNSQVFISWNCDIFLWNCPNSPWFPLKNVLLKPLEKPILLRNTF